MIEYFIIGFLVCAIAFLIYFIARLANKVDFYENWIVAFKNRIEFAHEKIVALDIRGSFAADDEVGFVFKDIKNILDDLDKFVE